MFAVSKLIEAALTTSTASGLGARFAYVGLSILHAKQTVWQIFRTLLADMERHQLVSFNGNDLSIKFLSNNNEIILSGIDNAEKNRGLHLHGIVLDEAQFCSLDIWNLILAPTLTQHTGWAWVLGTPNGPQGLFYHLAQIGDARQHGWTTVTRTIDDTGEVDPEEFAAFTATATKAQVAQEYYCSFDAAMTNRVYTSFDMRRTLPEDDHRQPHIRTDLRDMGQDLWVGMDFNVSFMPAVIAQKRGNVLEILGEIILRDATTDMMCAALKRSFPNRRIIVCPDAAGAQRGTAKTEGTDITLLRRAGFIVKVPKANPPVHDRISAVNVLIENAAGQRRLFVDARCENLIKTLTSHRYNVHTGFPDKTAGLDHAGDALGYLVMQAFPLGGTRFRQLGLHV